MAIQLRPTNTPTIYGISYNPTTKQVIYTAQTGLVTCQFVAYTTATCDTAVGDDNMRLYVGVINGTVGNAGGASEFPNMPRVFGTWNSTFSQELLITPPDSSVDAKYYNSHLRGKGMAWRAYQYHKTQPSIRNRWRLYVETGGDGGVGYCATILHWEHQITLNVGSEPPLPPSAQIITVASSCIGNVSTNTVNIPSPNTTNVDYFSVRKSATIDGTYTEIAKLYVSGGTFSYADTTGVSGYYKVYSSNDLYIDDFPSNVVFGNLNAIIQAQVVWSDFPVLTFTAQTTNFCADVDTVLWYLDGQLTGTTTGSTFTGVLPTSTDIYELTAKYVRDGVTGGTSNIVELIFYYNQTLLTGVTTTGTFNFTIPNYFNRMQLLLVAGGGAGGNAKAAFSTFGIRCCGGGGGAGGVLETIINNPIGGTYQLIVGKGDNRFVNPNYNDAENTSFYGQSAIRGGRGGNVTNRQTSGGQTGGSGGGGSGSGGQYGGYPVGGGAGTTGQGNSGGNGNATTGGNGYGGGGGGKASAGVNGGAGSAKSVSIANITPFNAGGGGGIRTTAGVGSNATGIGFGGVGGCGIGTDSTLYQGGNGSGGAAYIYLYNYYPEQPIAPTNLTISNIGCDNLKLNWTNNDTTEVDGIYILRNDSGIWTVIGDVSNTTTTFDVTGLLPNTNYEFRVAAYNELFTTPSASAIGTTLAAEPFNLSAIVIDLTSNISWQINDSTYGNSIIPLIRVSGSTTWTTGSTLPMTTTQYEFSGLSFNTDYEVMVVRVTDDGNYLSDIYEFSTADFIAPTINGYLIDDDVTIEIFDTNGNREFYEIYRDIGGTGFTLVDTIYFSGTTWTDYAIASGITYTYKVRSKLVTGFSPIQYSDYSNEIDAKIVILLAPSGLTISNIGYTGLTLTWVNNNTEQINGNYVQRIIGGVWTTTATVSSGTTTHNVTGLSPNTLYYFRVVAYNDVQTANSAAAQDTTLNPTPYGLSATTVTLFYQDIIWELPLPEFGDNIRVEYKTCDSGTFSTFATIGHDETQIRLTGLTYGECYDIRIVTHSTIYGDYPSETYELVIPAPNFPKAFCEDVNYSYSGTTCGNADGFIKIDNQEYFTYYSFSLTDIFGNTYGLTFEVFDNLPSGFYFLTATVRPEYWWWYGRDACTISWIKIEDYDNPAYLAGVSVKPLQCQPFDRQSGRIFYVISGVTANPYSFYVFTDDLSLYYSKTGITSTNDFILRNALAKCYYAIVVDEVTGCKLLIDRRCLPTIPLFSLAGIKKIWITPWSEDIDYNYWKDSDDDFFLEFEDTSFFTSTKIKEFISLSGGTIQWYSLPVAEKVCSLSQKLSKVRQGFVFQDTLTIAIAKANAEKWVKIANILNPENKWLYVILDENDFYWTGGYKYGGKIGVYGFKTGVRDEDNGYNLTITTESENKLLTSLDEVYVKNNIL